ncbi:MAG: 2-oxoacid:ferredoxin oxidoreductase subunit beta [Deltaproteobacteria bacterium]|nr:2-oxoacid:ferredoxin oxidoreductase subunit beta [Deltaproteobacteria bacterium]MBW2016032.1 2-oxoacid:ferredoxin oxidoreductase subunit beta [Deltaproteobacteria bacterium]MBW2128329.1 2-oxoacid:ferredoxin oxidoreductase subunit beta [Deltaproteobacteria bacterium]MBW2302157.1 2-oxoacid:ferredoxin oxidoreductase subunit beta [Deltaproteobacteria bacterium]
MARDLEKYLRPEVKETPFCPGCGHGILMGLLLRAVDGLGLDMMKVLFVSGIGCAAWIPSPNFKADTLHTLHGRAIPFATGAKAFNPELNVIIVSGDGDLVSIGGNHLIHAARRNTDITVICANNMIYGMTGGQLACTTPIGAMSSTYPDGSPYQAFDLVKLVSAAGARYVARFAVTQPLSLIGALKRAISLKGFTFVEVLSPCPTQFGRRNRYGSPEKMIEMLRDQCVTREEARGMKPEELEGKMVTGVFVDGGC